MDLTGRAQHQASTGKLSQRIFEEDRASSTSKDSLTITTRLLSVKEASESSKQARRLQERNGMYISNDEYDSQDLARDGEDDDTPEYTGTSTMTFTTAAPAPQGRAREDYDEILGSTGEGIHPDAASANPLLNSKPQTRNKTRMDSYDLPEPVLPSDEDGAMEDGMPNIPL